MRPCLFCLLAAVAASGAHAEISLVKPMTEGECRRVLRDAADMFYDSRYCAGAEEWSHPSVGWLLMGEINSKTGAEEFGRCPNFRLTGAERDAFLAPYPQSREPDEIRRFCTPENRARIAPLYRQYRPLLEELEQVRRKRRAG